MRQIGSISNLDQAERFADHLRSLGIVCSVDQDGNSFRLWVQDDDHVATAKGELPQFLADPNHQRYRDAARNAMVRMREDLRKQQSVRKNTVKVSETWNRSVFETCPLTIGLIAMSVVVAFFTGMNPQRDDPRVDLMWFSNDGTLQPILRGEVWRLISPIFLHLSPMHLIFNMLATQQFGMLIESRLGTLKFLGMVVVIAVLSNFFQFEFRHQNFGGMSGVVYGLFGYAWVKGKLEPNTGFDLPQQAVNMMLVWFVICLIGLMGSIANWAHGVGLVTGIAMAASGSLLKPFLRGR